MKFLNHALIVTLVLVTAGCQKADPQSDPGVPEFKVVSGSITYLERMALPDEAVAEISLQDVSIADAPAELVARQRIRNPGQVPIHFELSFPPEEIDPRRVYAIQARITLNDQLLFISDTHTPVLTRGAGDEVSMTLVRAQNSEVVETSQDGDTPGIELEGMFRYMADAAIFRDCRNNLSFPVAMEAQFPELERAYLNSDVEAGNEALVRLRGRYLERPSMEGNSNEVNLIVDVFKEISDDSTCAPDVHANLQDTYWKLLELDGNPVITPQGGREPHLILASTDSLAKGHAGCNNFFGSYQAEDDTLTFSPIGATMMACPSTMDTERAFLGVLGNTTRAEISGQIMSLYADDRLLARFEAVYL